jgi:hypothetical protein
MTSDFEIAGGTVTGRDHVTTGRNNQDAFCWSVTPEATVAVVSDGCGSGRHSEVGAQLGARLLTEALRTRVRGFDDPGPDKALAQVRLDVLAQLRVLANAMGGHFTQVVADYFLFTALGFVVTKRRAVVFGLGDGLLAINGAVQRLTAPNNEPPYLGYGLVPSTLRDDVLSFVVHAVLPAGEAQALAVGTDGAGDIADVAEFWTSDRYFANPYNVGRRLNQLNRKPGVLPDDSTLVVLRRRTGR